MLRRASALDKKMNSNDVYQKSTLGREEIRSQSLGVLPREARTLLIMIDGKKTYQSYVDSLNESKMFAEFGGVTPLFELLLEFQCIELTAQSSADNAEAAAIATSAQTRASFVNNSNTPFNNQQLDTAQPQTNGLQSVASQPSPTQPNSESDFAADFNKIANEQQANLEVSKGGSVKRKATEVSYESIKSDLATYIEKNAPAQDAWGYLLSLEQCENDGQLLALTQRIQNTTGGGNLSSGMSKYITALTKH